MVRIIMAYAPLIRNLGSCAIFNTVSVSITDIILSDLTISRGIFTIFHQAFSYKYNIYLLRFLFEDPAMSLPLSLNFDSNLSPIFDTPLTRACFPFVPLL